MFFFIRGYYIAVEHSSVEKKIKSTFIIIVFLSDKRKSLSFTHTKLYTQSKAVLWRDDSILR